MWITTQTFTNEQIGGKARQLILLSKKGFQVPEFVVIPQDYFTRLSIPYLENQQPDFENILLPNKLIQEITAHLGKDKLFAVRSSYAEEDSTDASAAGIFKTRLFVKADDLSTAILQVWKSTTNKEVKAYYADKNKEPLYFLSVIVQEMVKPDVSGVAFSMNPLSGHRKEMVVNAVYGLGEGLVSGQLNADQYVLSKDPKTAKIRIKRQIVEKEKAWGLNEEEGHGTIEHLLDEQKRHKDTLTEAQLVHLFDTLKRIQKQSTHYVDLEFCFANNKLFLLQARPVTGAARLPDMHGKYVLWDNSNIVESYPGVTSPLTFSYIVPLYEKAYRQFVEMMGVSKKQIESNADYFANMLGYLNGRVYYNLRSWYRMLSLLPGFKLNAAFMEKMMGVKERFELDEIDHRTKLSDLLRLLFMLYKILVNLLTLSVQKRKFIHFFNSMDAQYSGIDPDDLSAHQIMDIYKKSEVLMLKNWKAPLANDFFAMIYFGTLQKQCTKLFGKDSNLHNDLLFGTKEIITTQPAERIRKIVQTVQSDSELTELFKKRDEAEIIQTLKQTDVKDILKMIEIYLKDFGDRNVAELKLETETFKQNPEGFVRVIRSYILEDKLPEEWNSAENIRIEAEQKLDQKLKYRLLKRALMMAVVKKTRKLISTRENLRFYRTRAFGNARLVFSTLGEIFSREGLLEKKEDIFFLTKNEIFDFIQGTSVQLNLKEMVKIRRKERAEFLKQTNTAERIRTHGIVYLGNDFSEAEHKAEIKGDLKGIGCCRGQVSGKARLAFTAEDAFVLKGDILVTKSTDPGWVTIFPSVKGILVERGSLLSHAAIVSREMGIPCIVGLKGITSMISNGDEVEMDGEKGTVRICNKHD